MQKAIMVQTYSEVEELNKLLDEGYAVESVDDNGVYILNLTNLETNPITKEESVMVNLDTSKAIKAMKLLEDTANKLKEKQPHVRIEFDDIRDVPKVWVDGKLIGRLDGNPLVSLNVNWNTDTALEGHKEFDIKYLDLSDGSCQHKGFHQGRSRWYES